MLLHRQHSNSALHSNVPAYKHTLLCHQQSAGQKGRGNSSTDTCCDSTATKWAMSCAHHASHGFNRCMQMTPRNALLACWSTGNNHKQQTEQHFLPPAVVWTEAHVHPDVIPVSKTIRYILRWRLRNHYLLFAAMLVPATSE